MASVRQSFKDDLKAAGLWLEFIAYRDDLKARELSPVDARDQAVAEFEPRVEEWKSHPDRSLSPQGAATPSGETAGAPPKSACCPDKGASPSRKPPKAKTVQSPRDVKEFVARHCDIRDVIIWVAKHLELPEDQLSIEDAPSAEAWGMLAVYRMPSRKPEFWDKIYGKLLPRGGLEDKDKGMVDGQALVDTIGKLLEIKKRSEAASDA